MFWVVVIGAPVLVLVTVGQIIHSVRSKVTFVRPTLSPGTLTTAANAPTTGPVAFGLACGAHMAVNQGVAWNDLTGAAFPQVELQATLAEMWGVHDGADWRRVVETKLHPHTNDPEHLAVEIRRQAGALTVESWREAVNQAGPLVAAADRVTRYEARFRADGLITGVVPSIRVYDWGRAANLARWGLRAGYCDSTEAENVLVRVGQLCAGHYASWTDLSAGFALGRLLFFPEEDFDLHYASVRHAHHTLLTAPTSPYRTLPWPLRSGFDLAGPR